MRSRQKILDATVAIVESDGFGGVTIAAVAHDAGVSRQTIYSIFGSREDLVSQAVAGVTMTALAEIYARVESAATPLEYLVELVVVGREAVREHPLLGTLLDGGSGNPLFDEGMMARSTPVALQILAPMVARHPAIEDRLADIVEVVIRLAMSVILFDSETVHTDHGLRQFLTRWLAPALPGPTG